MDLTEEYFSDCSPYIHELIYDLDAREVQLVCVNNPDERVPFKRLKFSNVLGFSEKMFDDALAHNLMDSVIGIHFTQDGSYCVHTEKRELIIRVGTAPVSLPIAVT
jgi:hypothetical protein